MAGESPDRSARKKSSGETTDDSEAVAPGTDSTDAVEPAPDSADESTGDSSNPAEKPGAASAEGDSAADARADSDSSSESDPASGGGTGDDRLKAAVAAWVAGTEGDDEKGADAGADGADTKAGSAEAGGTGSGGSDGSSGAGSAGDLPVRPKPESAGEAGAADDGGAGAAEGADADAVDLPTSMFRNVRDEVFPSGSDSSATGADSEEAARRAERMTSAFFGPAKDRNRGAEEADEADQPAGPEKSADPGKRAAGGRQPATEGSASAEGAAGSGAEPGGAESEASHSEASSASSVGGGAQKKAKKAKAKKAAASTKKTAASKSAASKSKTAGAKEAGAKAAASKATESGAGKAAPSRESDASGVSGVSGASGASDDSGDAAELSVVEESGAAEKSGVAEGSGSSDTAVDEAVTAEGSGAADAAREVDAGDSAAGKAPAGEDAAGKVTADADAADGGEGAAPSGDATSSADEPVDQPTANFRPPASAKGGKGGQDGQGDKGGKEVTGEKGGSGGASGPVDQPTTAFRARRPDASASSGASGAGSGAAAASGVGGVGGEDSGSAGEAASGSRGSTESADSSAESAGKGRSGGSAGDSGPPSGAGEKAKGGEGEKAEGAARSEAESESERTSKFVPLRSADAPPRPTRKPAVGAEKPGTGISGMPPKPASPPSVAGAGVGAEGAGASQAGQDGTGGADADAEGGVGEGETERTRQQPMPDPPPLDLLAQLTNKPPPPETPLRTAVRRVKIWTPLVLLLVIVFVVVQAVRPLPDAELSLTASEQYTFEGSKPSMPWPSEGQAAVDVDGLGSLGSHGEQKPVPIASVAKVMTAYIILRDHPVKKGEEGKQIPVDKKAEDEAGLSAQNESTVEVKEGDKISQTEAIDAIMIASANNVARLLARWDAGSEKKFAEKMNETARELGMEDTHYTDPSGLRAETVSTAADQVKLGKKAMEDPAFRASVRKPSYEDSKGDSHNNWNGLVPVDGVVGIKPGTTTKAGGNLLFATEKKVGDTTQLIVGAVLGQYRPSILDTVLAESKKLSTAAQDALRSAKVVRKGDVVGHVDDQLGEETPLVATEDVEAVGWSGLRVRLSLTDGGETVPDEASEGDRVGFLTAGKGPGQVRVPVALGEDKPEPGFGAKLTRIL